MMLTGASRRGLPRELYKRSRTDIEAIQLPFLCPALFTPRRTHRSTATISQSSTRLSRRNLTQRNHSDHRHLASAAAAVAYDIHDDYIPFEGGLSHGTSARRGSPLDALNAFAPGASPLILSDPPTTEPGKFRVKNGISGDLNEIHQTLHACLQVGRLERAAALVRRLNEIYKSDAPGLITAHNDYIREVTLRIIRTKDPDLLRDLHRWYAVDLRRKFIKPTPVTYALLIQATVHGSGEEHADRSVKRFLKLAKESGVEHETKQLVLELEENSKLVLQYLEDPTKSSETDTPEIRPVMQKGLGLSTLQKSLKMFNQDARSDYMKEIEGDQVLSLEDRQRLLERSTLQAALDRWHEEDAHRKSLGISNILATSSLGAIMWKWHEKLVPLVEAELKRAKEAENQTDRSPADADRLLWGPYMQSVPADKLSALTILSCMKTVALDAKDQRGTKVLAVVSSIGRAIQEEARCEMKNARHKFRQWRDLSLKKDDQDFHWPMAIKIKMGATLLSHLIESAQVTVSRQDLTTGAKLQEDQPVFYHTYGYQAGKRVGVIRLNPSMSEKLSKAPLSPSVAKNLPMLVQPRPWVGFREGGFLERTTPVVRLDPADLQAKRYAIAASKNGDMSQVFAGLDVLAKTPWKINRGVFDVMVEAWNSGEAIAKIPPENPTVEMPPEPPADSPLRERVRWLKKVKEIDNYKGGLRSNRCFLNFQLEVARAYLHETFYFPHNIDFRGRAYPMAPFLNHMGADNARGLLRFAEERILGQNGLRWLKIHLANMFGYDKASLQERVTFTEDHMPDIIDSAENGLHGSRWWLTAEDPWQTLAACKELAAAMRNPDPTRFRSSLAIHQDGTCNGLQHYAALGGDTVGAKQVNLEPGDRPSDIYTAVAEMVKTEIREEAQKGIELAIQLDGRVTRKVVKQTVMTNVYGVTFIGAKAQVRKQLDLTLTSFPDTRLVNKNTASIYIAKKIFSSLARMFNGAHDIQYWFGDCAGRICNSISPDQIIAIRKESEGETRPTVFRKKIRQLKGGAKIDPKSFKTGIIWTTPLKMPVVQSYAKRGFSKVNTSLQLVTIQNPLVTDPVHRSKQLQAFPPNFIHSLDGTHMFLTALKCHELGLHFAAVHDSFWTHAGDVDTLNRVTRDAFIRMHSENIIGRLSDEFKTRYKGHIQLASVHPRTAVAKKIAAWRKANGRTRITSGQSPGRITELLLEAKRQELLSSADPQKRKEGEQMVTPGSIYEQSHPDERITQSEIPVTLGQTRKLKAELVGFDTSVADNSPLNADDGPFNEDDSSLNDDDVGSEEAVSAEALGEQKRRKAREHRDKNRKTLLWAPLTFPPVPEKGEFDVTRLRDSQYFFS